MTGLTISLQDKRAHFSVPKTHPRAWSKLQHSEHHFSRFYFKRTLQICSFCFFCFFLNQTPRWSWYSWHPRLTEETLLQKLTINKPWTEKPQSQAQTGRVWRPSTWSHSPSLIRDKSPFRADCNQLHLKAPPPPGMATGTLRPPHFPSYASQLHKNNSKCQQQQTLPRPFQTWPGCQVPKGRTSIPEIQFGKCSFRVGDVLGTRKKEAVYLAPGFKS